MSGPLAGIRIADFSWVGAGPRATKDLADLGATVIKIESRKRLDLGRLSAPFRNDRRDPDGSAFFAIANTSKRSVTINLADPKGVAVAKRLVAWSDVVVENFGKGYMERIGLPYSVLSELRPDIIAVSVSVAGRAGPDADLRGYGNSAAALSGLAALSGWPDRAPHMPPFAYGDVVAPMFATVAVLAALEHRRRTGRGQSIDVSQVEPLVHVLADCFVERQLGTVDMKQGNRSRTMAPHGAFPCRGPDQWCAIAVRDDNEWQRLCLAIGNTTAATDARFSTFAARKQCEDELEAVLATWTSGYDKHVLADRLSQLGIPAEAVQDGREVFTDRDLIAAGHYARTQHAVLEVRHARSTNEILDAHGRGGRSPFAGRTQSQRFVDLLGMSEQDVSDLVSCGALA